MNLIKTTELIKEPIRALWWRQPYATLMLHGKIETRTWGTEYRGLVLICASKLPYTVDDVAAISDKHCLSIHEILKQESKPDFDYGRPFSNIPQGVAIAVGRLVESRLMVRADEKKAFVVYYPELYCHLYADVTPIKPFEIKGCQGWKKLEGDVWDKIEFVNN